MMRVAVVAVLLYLSQAGQGQPAATQNGRGLGPTTATTGPTGMSAPTVQPSTLPVTSQAQPITTSNATTTFATNTTTISAAATTPRTTTVPTTSAATAQSEPDVAIVSNDAILDILKECNGRSKEILGFSVTTFIVLLLLLLFVILLYLKTWFNKTETQVLPVYKSA